MADSYSVQTEFESFRLKPEATKKRPGLKTRAPQLNH